MLASAASRVKDRWIYVTGGNDDTVGIWDLTETSLEQDELKTVGNGTVISLILISLELTSFFLGR